MKYHEEFFKIKKLISLPVKDIANVNSQFFIVGPHASGKSTIAKAAWSDKDTLFFDTGPILRQYHHTNDPLKSFGEWLDQNEQIYGDEFTDKLLAAHIYMNTTSNAHIKRVVIIGNRSLPGVMYLKEKLGISYSKLIYVTSPKLMLYERYKKREGKSELSQVTFDNLLRADQQRGLEEIEIEADLSLVNDRTLNDAVGVLKMYLKRLE